MYLHTTRQVFQKADMIQKTFDDFVSAINEHSVDKLCALMTDDHKFIDSLGNETAGSARMRVGWSGYFQLFPDYKIVVTEVLTKDNTIAAYGFASGTFKGLTSNKENYWHLPAAWRAIIQDKKIHLWQVYADSKLPYDIITRNKEQPPPDEHG
jgi:ketosteroid isomerase-like protein